MAEQVKHGQGSNSSQPTEPKHNPQGRHKCSQCRFRHNSIFVVGEHAVSHITRYIAIREKGRWFVYDRDTNADFNCNGKAHAHSKAKSMNAHYVASLQTLPLSSSNPSVQTCTCHAITPKAQSTKGQHHLASCHLYSQESL